MTISIDGPREIHDKSRVDINNQGTFNKTYENIKRIYDYNPSYFKNYVQFSTSVSNDIDFENQYFDPEEVGVKYLEEIAGGSVFCAEVSVAELLKKQEKP